MQPSSESNMRIRLSHLRRTPSSRYLRRKAVRQKKTRSCIDSSPEPSTSCSAFPKPFTADTITISPFVLFVNSPTALHSGASLSPTASESESTIRSVSNTPSTIPSSTNTTVFEPRTNAESNVHYRDLTSKPLSIRSLGRRLAGRYSGSYIDHVSSVLRYSSTNSWRSSIMSIASLASSLQSLRSSRVLPDSSPEDRMTGIDPAPEVGQKTGLSENEQEVWNELVDESSLTVPFRARPHYRNISLVARSCCDLNLLVSKKNPSSSFWQPDGLTCSVCGFSVIHCYARKLVDEPDIKELPQASINAVDNFGNTPLHFLASSGRCTLIEIISLINRGANVHTRNTSGETFLHVLELPKWIPDTSYLRYMGETYEPFDQLIEILELRVFSFQQRDYHGRSLCYALFSQCLQQMREPWLFNLLSKFKADLNDCDSLGNSWKTLYTEWQKSQHLQIPRDLPIHDYIDPSTVDLEFKARFLQNGVPIPREPSKQKKLVAWIDKSGDTLLHAILKAWPHDGDEMSLTQRVTWLLDIGSEIHMRDRQGRTLLAIAVVKGFRPVVVKLLDRGANIHSRNYQGKGILQEAQQELLKARKSEDDKLYAGILSCINALVDAGTKSEPTERDEWLTNEARAVEAIDNILKTRNKYAHQRETK
jgi:hypothetical protein